MGLCAGETSKKKKAFKTIIIPKGVINPNENNVIEIPNHLDANSNLIVKGPTDSKACLSVEPYSTALNDFQQPVGGRQTPSSQEPVYFIDQNPKNVGPAAYIQEPSTHGSVESRRIAVPLDSAIPMRTIDFGVQTSTTTLNPSVTPTYQPKTVYQPSGNYAHSPLCPICSRPSCKYLRPYSNLFSDLAPTYISCPKIKQMDNYNPYRTYDHSMKLAKSDIIPRSERSSRYLDENTVLNRILDDKIEKMLKPILLSIAKSIQDDEEREIMSSNIGPKYSSERYPRRTYSPPSLLDSSHYIKPAPYFESTKRSNLDSEYYQRSKFDDSYDRFRRGTTMKDSNRYESKRYADEDEYKRRRPRSSRCGYATNENLDKSRTLGRACPTTSGCERRANVYFEPWHDFSKASSQTSLDSYDLYRTHNDRTSTDLRYDK